MAKTPPQHARKPVIHVVFRHVPDADGCATAHVLQQIGLRQSNEDLGVRKRLLVGEQKARLENVAKGVTPLAYALLFGTCEIDVDDQTGDIDVRQTFQ